jgi:hypothetical protein
MTEHRPPACHYDRALGERVTREHRDDCTNPDTHRGCKPCTAPHCAVCGHEHLSNDHPLTCPTCLGKVRDDLTTIASAYAELADEALEAGADGRLVAAAPIPGGNAAVLTGPSVQLDQMRTGSLAGIKTLTKDHRPEDHIPPLAILAQWEDLWRAWLDHPRTADLRGRRAHRQAALPPAPRATVAGAVAYLTGQLGYMAQHAGPGVPDWAAFTRQIRTLRSRLEHTLHDEQQPERGVECFDCGDRLVRRFRGRRTCKHRTPARRHLQQILTNRDAALVRLAALEVALNDPDPSKRPTPLKVQVARNAAALPTPVELAAARRPCDACSQGGIDDPGAGLSWECPGCRKEYSPGEYATAVRRDLAENGADGDGWTHMTMAAEAATTSTGVLVPAATVRLWVHRGKVASKLNEHGSRLVYWPDVFDQANQAVARAHKAAVERRRREEQRTALEQAIARGEDPEEAGIRLGIHPLRVAKFMTELEQPQAS